MGNNVVSILQHITTMHRYAHDRVIIIGDQVFYYDSRCDTPWIEIVKKNHHFLETFVGFEKGNRPNIGNDIEDLMRYLETPFGTEHHTLLGIVEIGQFIDRLIATNDETHQRHQAYFTLVNEVGERYKLAVDAIRDVVVNIGHNKASLDSVSYLDAVRELNESSRAFKALVTSVADVEFTKE